MVCGAPSELDDVAVFFLHLVDVALASALTRS